MKINNIEFLINLISQLRNKVTALKNQNESCVCVCVIHNTEGKRQT